MPPGEASQILARAVAAAAAAGQDWHRLLDDASEVAVFGSTAASMDGPFSDVDILVTGRVRSRKTRTLDLIVHPQDKLWTPEWLGSELAGHIAAYGVWLKGTPLWVREAKVGEIALDRKLARIQRLLAATQRHWLRLDVDFRRQSLTSIRRELQRASLLERGIAIPPTPELDRMAAGALDPKLSEWVRELGEAGVMDTDATLLARLAGEVPQPSSAYQRR